MHTAGVPSPDLRPHGANHPRGWPVLRDVSGCGRGQVLLPGKNIPGHLIRSLPYLYLLLFLSLISFHIRQWLSLCYNQEMILQVSCFLFPLSLSPISFLVMLSPWASSTTRERFPGQFFALSLISFSYLCLSSPISFSCLLFLFLYFFSWAMA